MRTDDFDFDLPDDLIALRPLLPREDARLLVIARNKGIVAEARIGDLPQFLRAGDAIIVNDTKVIPCALEGLRKRGDLEARFSATLHRRISGNEWRAFVKPGRRLAEGDRLVFGADNDRETLTALLIEKSDSGDVLIRFDREGTALDDVIARIGAMPLPPYIASKRAADAQDIGDYQTVYAAKDGSVAAPTAGLHLTPLLLAALSSRNVSRQSVTLHVGAGTFLPVKSDRIADHVMHPEWGEVSAATANDLTAKRSCGGRLIAIGTTSLRLIESAARQNGQLAEFSGETDIFITPGYRFLAVDGLLTNFHLPRSTLFMLVSAFAGYEVMKAAYAHAISARYRFFSYGDACLLLPGD